MRHMCRFFPPTLPGSYSELRAANCLLQFPEALHRVLKREKSNHIRAPPFMIFLRSIGCFNNLRLKDPDCHRTVSSHRHAQSLASYRLGGACGPGRSRLCLAGHKRAFFIAFRRTPAICGPESIWGINDTDRRGKTETNGTAWPMVLQGRPPQRDTPWGESSDEG